MTELEDIQALIKTTIEAGPSDDTTYFNGESVIADTGTSKDDIENALNTRGFVVIADVPLQAKAFERAPGVTLVYVTCPVHVQLNPTANSSSTGAGKTLMGAVQKVMSAMHEYGDGQEEERFELEEDAWDLFVNDAGLYHVAIWFRKLVSHN